MIFTKDLPVDSNFPESCVYWIYREDKHTDPRISGYVGVSSRGVESRFKRHLKDMNNGSKLIVHRAMRKYGDRIKVKVLFLADPEFCLLVEHALRPAHLMIGTWNIHAGGNKGALGATATEETRLKMSAALKGRKLAKEHSEKIAAANRGRKLSPEQVEKIKLRMVGFKHTTEAKLKIGSAALGRRHSEEARANMSSAQTHRVRSEKELAKLVARNKEGLSAEAETRRIESLRATRKMEPWRNSSIRNFSVWLKAAEIEEFLNLDIRCNTNKLATTFGTTRDKMETIHKNILSGWCPSEDVLFQKWLEQYKAKEASNAKT